MLYPKGVGDYICLKRLSDSLGEDPEDEVVHVFNPHKVIETLVLEDDTYVFLHRDDVLGVLVED